MRKAQVGLVLVLVLSVMFSFGCCPPEEEEGPSTGLVEGPKVRITLGSSMAEGHYMDTACEMFVEQVEARAPNITVVYYGQATLYNDVDAARVLPVGGIDMYTCQAGIFGQRIKSWNSLLTAPYSGWDHFWAVEDDPRIRERKAVDVEEQMNIKVLSWFHYYLSQTYASRVSINSTADLEGLKIRVPAPLLNPLIQAWGASPIMLSPGEVYMALYQGAVDAAFSGYSRILLSRWYECADYLWEPTVGYGAGYAFAMNLDKWNSLPPQYQELILEIAQELEQFCREQGAIDDERDRTILIEEKGMIECDWRGTPLQDEWDAKAAEIMEAADRAILGDELYEWYVQIIEEHR
ncbi:MAG: TRAP transporter substrate-binding protein [Dehalococcoidia bacterium]|nr:TRAP transporter substrate-binding protein [Dehalococcoidia bacterium]